MILTKGSAMLILMVIMAGCTRNQALEKNHFTGEIQGTYYAVTYFTAVKTDYRQAVDSLLHEFDLTASLWVKNSLINRVNENEEVEVNRDFRELWRISREVSEVTGGYFDITVGPLVKAWGFGVDNKPEIRNGTIDSLLPLVNYRNAEIVKGKVIRKVPGMRIDFNAVAQGYSVDLVCAFLESRGVRDYLVDIGGEVFAQGAKPGGEPWKIGIEKPSDQATSSRVLLAELPVRGRAVATSGNYRKYYEKEGKRYSHTIDPKTGYPVDHSMLSVTVVADRCAYADAYATAFMAMGPDRAKKFLRENSTKLEMYCVYSTNDGLLRTFMTKGLETTLSEVP